MRRRRKILHKKYCVFAKRNQESEWSVWTDSNELNVAMAHLDNIRSLGFLGKVTDRRKHKIIASD
jgi:hypothetical protein